MAKVKVYNIAGAEVGTMELNKEVFGTEYNEALIHQVIVAQLANKRQGTKSTLTRSEVRGGGAKPWRQKGTGRARQGSIRSPQWIKGGVVFAPKPRDFSKKVNKQMNNIALKSALSAKVADGNLVVLDELKMESGKTKDMVSVLKNFPYKNSAMIVIAGDDAMIKRAAGNIQGVSVVAANLINVYEIVANNKCIVTKDAIKKIEEVFA